MIQLDNANRARDNVAAAAFSGAWNQQPEHRHGPWAQPGDERFLGGAQRPDADAAAAAEPFVLIGHFTVTSVEQQLPWPGTMSLSEIREVIAQPEFQSFVRNFRIYYVKNIVTGEIVISYPEEQDFWQDYAEQVCFLTSPSSLSLSPH